MSEQPTAATPTLEKDQQRQLRELEGAVLLVPAIKALYRALKADMDPSDALALTQTIVAATVRNTSFVINNNGEHAEYQRT